MKRNLANLANFWRKFGKILRVLAEIWRIFAPNFGGNLANFGGIALCQENLGYFG